MTVNFDPSGQSIVEEPFTRMLFKKMKEGSSPDNAMVHAAVHQERMELEHDLLLGPPRRRHELQIRDRLMENKIWGQRRTKP